MMYAVFYRCQQKARQRRLLFFRHYSLFSVITSTKNNVISLLSHETIP